MSKSRCQLKVIVLGDSSVGKTSLLNRFVNNNFSQYYQATIGADFTSKQIVIDDRHISLQLWDTAGQERFQSLGHSFYRGADVCILVYDITSQKSFDSIISWKQEFLNQCGPPQPETFPFMVVGNKSDLDNDRAVSLAKSNQWARENDLPLIETSAKDAVRIEEVFIEATRRALKRDKVIVPQLNNGITLVKPENSVKKVNKKCC